MTDSNKSDLLNLDFWIWQHWLPIKSIHIRGFWTGMEKQQKAQAKRHKSVKIGAAISFSHNQFKYFGLSLSPWLKSKLIGFPSLILKHFFHNLQCCQTFFNFRMAKSLLAVYAYPPTWWVISIELLGIF